MSTLKYLCLTYGMNSIELSKNKGTVVKGCLWLGKRHRHSRLLRALNIPSVSHVVKQDTTSLIYRV